MKWDKEAEKSGAVGFVRQPPIYMYALGLMSFLLKKVIADADYTVRIPMRHGVDSLNVAAAAAVAFYVFCWREYNKRVRVVQTLTVWPTSPRIRIPPLRPNTATPHSASNSPTPETASILMLSSNTLSFMPPLTIERRRIRSHLFQGVYVDGK